MKTLLGIFAQFLAFVFVSNVCFPTKAHAYYAMNMSEEQFVQIMKAEFDKLSDEQKETTTKKARSMMKVINAQLMKIDFKVKKNQITEGEANQMAREYVGSMATRGASNLDLDKETVFQLRKTIDAKINAMTLSDLQRTTMDAESHLSTYHWWDLGFFLMVVMFFVFFFLLICYPFYAVFCIIIGGIPVYTRYGDLRCLY